MTLGTERIRTLDDIRAPFLGVSEAADITPQDREAAYPLSGRRSGSVTTSGCRGAGKGLIDQEVPRQGHRLTQTPS